MKCTLVKPSQATARTPRMIGSQLPPPGLSGRRKFGPRGPPERRGPSGPRCLKISSMFAERRRSSEPPPGSQGLRGPLGGFSPEDGASPPSPCPPAPLLPPGLPHGLRLPAIASTILSIIPPFRSIGTVIGAGAAKNRGAYIFAAPRGQTG